MVTKMPNLWPSVASKTDIQTPLAILRAQASLLTEVTHGILRGEVKSYRFNENDIVHVLDIVAPSLENYRYRILTVKHDNISVYPAYVQEGFVKTGQLAGQRADDEEQFLGQIGKIIGNTGVVIQNLIIRSNKPDEIEFASSEELMAEV